MVGACSFMVRSASRCSPSFLVFLVVSAIFVPRLLVVGSCVVSFVIQINVWISHRFRDVSFCGLGFVICIGRWYVCSLVDECFLLWACWFYGF